MRTASFAQHRCPRCNHIVYTLRSATVMHECPKHPKHLLTMFDVVEEGAT